MRLQDFALATAASLFSVTAAAQDAQPPDPVATDPARMGWMEGSPPPPDKAIRWADGSFYQFPQFRWSFANWNQFVPVVDVWRGDGPVAELPRVEGASIGEVSFRAVGADRDMTVAEGLEASFTDSIVVLHRGRIVQEDYFGVMTPHTRHIAHSVTKSVIGTLAAMLVAEGQLDREARVTDYIPELAESGFAAATVRDVLDMTSGVRFSENYADPDAEIWPYVRAGGILPSPPGYEGPRSFYDFAKTVGTDIPPGDAFVYQTVNSDIVGWLIRRVTGGTVAGMLSERIWRKLGAERDALMAVDPAGNAFAGGGLMLTTRDLARFGEMMRLGGSFNGQDIVPAEAVDAIRAGGDPELFARAGYETLPGWSYRDMWWVANDDNGSFTARGVHGQAIFVYPTAEMVIARFASQPQAANAAFDPVLLPMYRAIADELMRE